MKTKIEAFEMLSYRRIIRISWKEMKSNAEVLQMIGLKNAERVLNIKKKKLAYYKHVRRDHSLQKLELEGKVDGKRGGGRRRKSWNGNVSEMTKTSMAQYHVKRMVHHGLQPLRRDGPPMMMMMMMMILTFPTFFFGFVDFTLEVFI